MNDHADLITRLEAATEGSRELSDEVLLARGWTNPGPNVLGDTGWRLPNNEVLYTTHTHLFTRPHPTVSVDDANTMMLEGWHVSHAWWDNESATFNLTKEVKVYAAGKAATPALALCIAILRANDG